MEIIVIILLVAGLLCFLADAFLRVPLAYPRLTALGLACWILTALLAHVS